jgi:hypothetical protein
VIETTTHQTARSRNTCSAETDTASLLEQGIFRPALPLVDFTKGFFGGTYATHRTEEKQEIPKTPGKPPGGILRDFLVPALERLTKAQGRLKLGENSSRPTQQ